MHFEQLMYEYIRTRRTGFVISRSLFYTQFNLGFCLKVQENGGGSGRWLMLVSGLGLWLYAITFTIEVIRCECLARFSVLISLYERTAITTGKPEWQESRND
jgi:hypothetical protein